VKIIDNFNAANHAIVKHQRRLVSLAAYPSVWLTLGKLVYRTE